MCAELNGLPLDRSRPLWELWLLTGLADGNVGLLIRLHHAVADGVAQRATVRVMSRQRLVNLFTSNLPGPPTRCILRARESWTCFRPGRCRVTSPWEWG